MAIEKLPNYCCGKIYKRWDKVSKVYGGSATLASKTDKKGNSVQLLITDGGARRQLINNTSEIIDEIDTNGVKRAYCYERQADGKTAGFMVISKNLPEDKKPFILAAKWISHNLRPIMAELKVNPNHKKSKIIMSEITDENNVVRKYVQPIVSAKIEEFESSSLGVPIPKMITFVTPEGHAKVVKGEVDETKSYIRQLDLIGGNPNIGTMRVIV